MAAHQAATLSFCRLQRALTLQELANLIHTVSTSIRSEHGQRLISYNKIYLDNHRVAGSLRKAGKAVQVRAGTGNRGSPSQTQVHTLSAR